VPVLTALDNAGGVYEAILPSLTTIEAALDGRIAAGSVVCSDVIEPAWANLNTRIRTL
jgi:hypothetical protein